MSKFIDFHSIERMSDEDVVKRVAELEKQHKDWIEQSRRNTRNKRIMRALRMSDEMKSRGEI